VLFLDRGRAVETGAPDRFFSIPRPNARANFSSATPVTRRRQALRTIQKGNVHHASDLPSFA